MTGIARVKLHLPHLHCAMGCDWEDVWGGLGSPTVPGLAPWPDELMSASAHIAREPELSPYGVDRKLVRTMEKQARMALAGAGRLLDAWHPGAGSVAERAETGLFMGLPTIDEPLPGLAVLESWHAYGGRDDWNATLMRETPPFSGLSLLNSSACAHIAATFGLNGPIAAYSPFADAGLSALIDGVHAVAEAECRHAVIGAVSTKLDPLQPLQHAYWGSGGAERQRLPGEASAFLLASADAARNDAVLLGYARGCHSTHDDRGDTVSDLIGQTLEMGGYARTSVGWVLSNQPWQAAHKESLSRALFAFAPLHLPIETRFGYVGPAAATLGVGLVLEGMRRKRRWLTQGTRWEALPMDAPCSLLVMHSPMGQVAVALIGRAGL
ncbi:MAG: hypothetical protein JSS57_22480 [Proteobacteria bacterium]|nr:hypothetical protein [Pseudomonadota bacterium]